MQFEYKTKGTCSQRIFFEIEDGKLHNVQYLGGCNGNLQGIGRLVSFALASSQKPGQNSSSIACFSSAGTV